MKKYKRQIILKSLFLFAFFSFAGGEFLAVAATTPAVPGGGITCGNGQCEAGEDIKSCPQDCHGQAPGKPKYAKRRLIVKFKDSSVLNPQSVKAARQLLMIKGQAAIQPAPALETNSLTINFLNKNFKLTGINVVFEQLPDEAAVKQKYSARSARVTGHNTNYSTSNNALANIYEFQFATDLDMEVVAGEYQKDPAVEYAHPDYIMTTEVLPNDPYVLDPQRPVNDPWSRGAWGQTYEDMWGLRKIEVDKAWDTFPDPEHKDIGKDVVVAVVDTGLDYNHEDISENLWQNSGEIPGNGMDDDQNGFVDDIHGYDFTTCEEFGLDECNIEKRPDSDPIDEHGHGSHVSGTIAGVTNNAKGIAGISWHTKIMAVQGLNKQGMGYTSDLADAIQYAVAKGADVINMSFGGYTPDREHDLIGDIVRYAYTQGVILVAAAGNESSPVRFFSPARLSEVITVAATDNGDNVADFSNFGPEVDIAAPGVEILSLRAFGTDIYNGAPGYTIGARFVPAFDINAKNYRANGTSMAAPHVAGVAALVLSKNPTFTNEQIKSTLLLNADDKGAQSKDDYYGFGRLNARKALTTPQSSQLPLAVIIKPGDHETLKGTDIIEVTGIALADKQNFKSYRLEYDEHRFGGTPQWRTIPPASSGTVANGLLGRWDIRGLNDGYYTLQLTVESENPLNRIQILNEIDRQIVQIGNKIKTGWPIDISYPLTVSPVITDIDGKGQSEIVVSDQGPNLYVFHADGTVAAEWGWPRKFNEVSGPYGSPAVGDLDKNYPGVEIVVGNKYAFHYDGTPVNGWPNPLFLNLPNTKATPTLVDVNGDGNLEVIVPGPDQKMYVLKSDGTVLWSRDIPGANYDFTRGVSAAVGDLDNSQDGKREIAFMDDRANVYIWDKDGNLFSGWPKVIGNYHRHFGSVVMGDIDGDGLLELVAVSTDGYIYAWHFDKTKNEFVLLPGWGVDVLNQMFFLNNSPALADILREDGSPGKDGKLELIFGVLQWIKEESKYIGKVYVVGHNGNLMPGWPQDTGTLLNYQGNYGFGGIEYASPVVGDIDGGGLQEVIIGSKDRKLYAWHADGKVVSGFPMDLGDVIQSSPALGDTDLDGKLDLVVGTGDLLGDFSGIAVDGYRLYTLEPEGAYDPKNIEWGHLHHDPQHTGLYPLPFALQVTVWPGDNNNDGVVNQADVLPLGLYWNKTGPARANASTAWAPQLAAPWTPENATYADANGDGVVNQADILPIGLNWGRTH